MKSSLRKLPCPSTIVIMILQHSVTNWSTRDGSSKVSTSSYSSRLPQLILRKCMSLSCLLEDKVRRKRDLYLITNIKLIPCMHGGLTDS